MKEPQTENDPRWCPLCGKFLRNLKAENKHFQLNNCTPVDHEEEKDEYMHEFC